MIAIKVIISFSSFTQLKLSKLEENIKFHISDVKYLCGDQYSEYDILAQEISLLKALEWKLVQPNLAEIIRLIFGCFVEEPQEQVYQRVEGSLDYCISSKIRVLINY